jgi:hypothetical protein
MKANTTHSPYRHVANLSFPLIYQRTLKTPFHSCLKTVFAELSLKIHIPTAQEEKVAEAASYPPPPPPQQEGTAGK